MADLIVTEKINDVAAEKSYEVITSKSAVDMDGNSIVVQGEKIKITVSEIDRHIATLQTQMVKWNLIKDEIGRVAK